MTIENASGSGVPGMNGLDASSATKIDKQLFGAGVVKTTLDYMNSDPFGGSGKNADYDFQTKVLEAGFMAKGTMVSGKV